MKKHSLLFGKLDLEVLEANLTRTYFYFSQVYAKLREVERSITYCGYTLMRQVERDAYETKDFALNCIQLADFY